VVPEAQHCARTAPNPYEAPGCQEANDPYERIFSCVPLFGVLALSASGVVA
jgi:hypothetical protein